MDLESTGLTYHHFVHSNYGTSLFKFIFEHSQQYFLLVTCNQLSHLSSLALASDLKADLVPDPAAPHRLLVTKHLLLILSSF